MIRALQHRVERRVGGSRYVADVGRVPSGGEERWVISALWLIEQVMDGARVRLA